MLEVELKSTVDDLAKRRALVERAGGRLVFEGRLVDRRYDTSDQALTARDHVLRLRVYTSAGGERAELDWKGPTRIEQGFKLREEIDAGVTDASALSLILERLGYTVTAAIDREIAQYELADATVRFERYPRLDDLVEVEGAPEAIERAIAATGLAREGFSADRLGDFARRFERRTGQRAALCDADLALDPPRRSRDG
jgi:predicted adenylyl cyclase CyaB